MQTIDDRETLVGLFASHDLECPSCGYCLRGLTQPTCPECNQSLVMRIGLAEPRVGLLIAGAVGWAAGLGFCGLLLVYWLVMASLRGGGPPTAGLFPLSVGFACGLVGLIAWVRFRGAVARASKHRRRGLVFLAWLVGIGFPVWFMAVIV